MFRKKKSLNFIHKIVPVLLLTSQVLCVVENRNFYLGGTTPDSVTRWLFKI